MRVIFISALSAIAVSPARIALHHSCPPLTAQVARYGTASAIAPSGAIEASQATVDQARRLDTTSSTNTTDTTKIQRPARPVIGRPAPQLLVGSWLNTPSGYHATFGDGHIYILDFTAMWCGSCPNTYPIVKDIIKQYASQGVRAIYVANLSGLAEDHESTLDSANELAALPEYFARHQVTEPVAIYMNRKVMFRDYSDDGNSIDLPKLIIIDGHGVVRDVMTGWDADQTRKEMFATIATLLPSPKAHQ